MNKIEHLITCLGEEGAEITQDCCKALRFGLDDRNVLNPTGPTNRERIITELNDLMAVVEDLVFWGVLPRDWEKPSVKSLKHAKIDKFLAYAKKVGALQ